MPLVEIIHHNKDSLFNRCFFLTFCFFVRVFVWFGHKSIYIFAEKGEPGKKKKERERNLGKTFFGGDFFFFLNLSLFGVGLQGKSKKMADIFTDRPVPFITFDENDQLHINEDCARMFDAIEDKVFTPFNGKKKIAA